MWLREALIWKRLTHPNIVPFIGVTLNPLQLVSEWMSGGNLTAYIKSNPRVDRVSLVSPSDPPLEHGLSFPTVGRRRGGA